VCPRIAGRQRLLARGRTNQEIGRELVPSVSTVKTHLEHIIAKLGVSDRTQAAVRAAELGLLAPDRP
jgi:DNA-binding NarL/FixJ family response regulator